MAKEETERLPKVTLGISCYCAEDTIARSIASARALDWPNLEIIVSDDCSTDNSVAIIEQEVARDDQIRLIRLETNQGVSAARNRIMDEASGEFVAFLDDDDECDPLRLREQWHRLTAYERAHGTELVFCYSDRDVITPDGVIHPSAVKGIGRTPPEPHGQDMADFVLWQHRKPDLVWGEFGSGTLFTRRSTLEAVGPFDCTFRRNAEWDLAVRLAYLGGHFISVDKPLLRQHVTISHDKVTPVRLASAVALRHKHKDYLTRRRLYWAALATTYARFYASNHKPWRSRAFLALACLANPYRLIPSVARNLRRKRRARG